MAAPEPCERLYSEAVQRVKRYMHHPFLAANRIDQQVSRFHFDVAHWLLSRAEVSSEEQEAVVDAVLLLQQGLSIHEEVDRVRGLHRQLTVLAGDYDSSRYYWLLARHALGHVIEALSEAVVRVNEAKMDLLGTGSPVSASRTLSNLEIIEGALLYAVAEVYHPAHRSVVAQVRAQVRRHVAARAPQIAPWVSPAEAQAWSIQAVTTDSGDASWDRSEEAEEAVVALPRVRGTEGAGR